MFWLIFMMFKWTIKLCVLLVMLEVWLLWAIVALPVALIASATGHDRTARQWQRSLRWRWRF
jgi:hypothetical protein